MEPTADMKSNAAPVVRRSSGNTLIVAAILAAIVGAGGFVGGMQYQKGHTTTSTSSASALTGAPSGNTNGDQAMGQMNGSFGSVTAISATSIRVKDVQANTTKTYSIDGKTTITDNGSTATYSAISVGDRVMVQTSSAATTTATQIQINPSMGGRPGGAGASDNQSTSSI